MMPLLVRS